MSDAFPKELLDRCNRALDEGDPDSWQQPLIDLLAAAHEAVLEEQRTIAAFGRLNEERENLRSANRRARNTLKALVDADTSVDKLHHRYPSMRWPDEYWSSDERHARHRALNDGRMVLTERQVAPAWAEPGPTLDDLPPLRFTVGGNGGGEGVGTASATVMTEKGPLTVGITGYGGGGAGAASPYRENARPPDDAVAPEDKPAMKIAIGKIPPRPVFILLEAEGKVILSKESVDLLVKEMQATVVVAKSGLPDAQVADLLYGAARRWLVERLDVEAWLRRAGRLVGRLGSQVLRSRPVGRSTVSRGVLRPPRARALPGLLARGPRARAAVHRASRRRQADLVPGDLPERRGGGACGRKDRGASGGQRLLAQASGGGARFARRRSLGGQESDAGHHDRLPAQPCPSTRRTRRSTKNPGELRAPSLGRCARSGCFKPIRRGSSLPARDTTTSANGSRRCWRPSRRARIHWSPCAFSRRR